MRGSTSQEQSDDEAAGGGQVAGGNDANKKVRKIQVQKQGIKVSNNTLRSRKKVNDASIGAQISLNGTPESDGKEIVSGDYQNASSGTVGMRKGSNNSPTQKKGKVPENVVIKNRKSPGKNENLSKDRTINTSTTPKVP